MRFANAAEDELDERAGAALRRVFADTEPDAPQGLAAAARARGQRIRARRTTACAVAASLVVVAAGAIAVRYGGPDDTTVGSPAAAAVPSSRPAGAAPAQAPPVDGNAESALPDSGASPTRTALGLQGTSSGDYLRIEAENGVVVWCRPPWIGYPAAVGSEPTCSAPSEPPGSFGDGSRGLLRLPGDTAQVTMPIVEGTSGDTLAVARAGHYPGTAALGEPGNFALALGRTDNASAYPLARLAPGSTVEVVGRVDVKYTYRIDRIVTVDPQATGVVDAVPAGGPYDRPGSYLTLTSPGPNGSATERIVAWGHLTDIHVG
ncbi:sortase domain-containing protein [Yinghuangia soli]|uniref:Sortase n=1 Tax=Yinghuangia soli TaxID=2908204 RepID=A0AA41Q696_9ACTN|nr:sortase [Yinghuangia soli]MCF2532354.1 sortase [Yinghuangia soli]